MVEYLVLNFCGLFSIVWFLGLSLSGDKKTHSAGSGLILLSGLRLL
ncbi:MAG: hypothetical protein GW761_11465 [Leptospira sp.]|nr:hypothetical protein [Leptospira sp.]